MGAPVGDNLVLILISPVVCHGSGVAPHIGSEASTRCVSHHVGGSVENTSESGVGGDCAGRGINLFANSGALENVIRA